MTINALANLDRARIMLAEARTLEEVKKIRDVAEAARVYAKAAHLGRDAQYHAAEIALLAAHRAGAILKKLPRGKPKAKGGRESDSDYDRTLKETKTPPRTAQRWQMISGVPEDFLQKYCDEVRTKGLGDISTEGLLRATLVKHRKSQSPFTHHITVPMRRGEYLQLRVWARNCFGPEEHLAAEQRFVRECVIEFFENMGLGTNTGNPFEDKAAIAKKFLLYLWQRPISESPMFKEVMREYDVVEADMPPKEPKPPAVPAKSKHRAGPPPLPKVPPALRK